MPNHRSPTDNPRAFYNVIWLDAESSHHCCRVLAADAQAQQKTPQTAAPKKSPCNQISDEAKCKAEATCSWIAALTDSKTGKQKRKAYCRTKSTPPAKKVKDAGKT